jgi:hypothetical protein
VVVENQLDDVAGDGSTQVKRSGGHVGHRNPAGSQLDPAAPPAAAAVATLAITA